MYKMYENLRDKNVNTGGNAETSTANSDKRNDDNDRQSEFKEAPSISGQRSNKVTDGTSTTNTKADLNSSVVDSSDSNVPHTATKREIPALNVELEILPDKHDEALLPPDAIPIPDDM